MKTRLPIILLAVVTALPWLAQTAVAQDGAEGSWYLRPRIGLSYYLGDNDQSINFQKGDVFNNVTPLNAALELGYHFSDTYSVGLAFAYSAYGNINDFDRDSDTGEDGGEDGTRMGVQLLARHRYGTGKVAPFVQAGLAASFGKTRLYENFGTPNVDDETSKTAFGPTVGVGVDFALSDNVSLALETGGAYLFGDQNSDGTDDDQNGGVGPGDWLGWNTVAVKFLLNRFVPVEVTDLVCPEGVVDTGDPVTFTASVNEKASKPVMGSWDFGDGASAQGMTASHAFTQEGTYTVTFTAMNGNGRGSDSRTCTVTAEDPCEAAEIIAINPSTMTPDTRTAIRFAANMRGSAPMEYSWDFGDGATSTEANPSHTYSEPGTYTVTLTVTNCGGTVSRTMDITVKWYEAAICAEIEEMNPVFFDRNSSTLTPDAREKLNENLEILRECPNMNARLEGWAAPGERRPQELSADRAKAVEQFYVDNGVAMSRLMTVGMGRAEGMTSKKEGLAGYRRVDTIPVRD